jgi:acyl-CoA synthetase (AMP-forming)/AMP-acid ligase II
MPSFATLTDALDRLAQSACGIHYIAGESSERRVPYVDMRGRSLGLLHHLQAAGARRGTHTILLLDGLAPFVDTFWACVLGRVVAVPLAPGNADEHKAKFFRVLARLPSPTLATERKVFDRLRVYANENGLADRITRLERSTVFLDEVSDVSVPGIEHRATPEDVAFIQFSSGSTSEPKGVILTHRNLTTNIAAIAKGVRARDDDASLSWMPLTHDMGLIGFHLTPLFEGVDHWLMPTALFVRRPGLWLAKTSEHRVSVTCSPNFGYMHYLKLHDPAKVAELDLSRLRIIFNGAEPIAADLCREFLAALAPARLAPNVMFPVYGLAEASLAVTFPEPGAPLGVETLARGALGPGDEVRVATDDAVELVRLGMPVQDCEVRIADEQGAEVRAGTVGRILIRGDNVSPGYYDDPALTQASRTADGFLDTGDLGTFCNGELVITGRVKEILFVAGQNHYPQDIDLVLAQYAGIELGRAAAAGNRPAHAATDDVLVFVLSKGDDLAAFAETARTVRRVVNERMGLPVAAVIPVRQFPKTTSGKIQRFALARDFEEGRFAEVLAELSRHDAGAAAPGAAAASDLEQALLSICQAALPNRTLSPDDNLFELGTGSLTLAQIYEKVEATYPGYLEVTDFFEYPTVRTMAAFLAQRQAEARA